MAVKAESLSFSGLTARYVRNLRKLKKLRNLRKLRKLRKLKHLFKRHWIKPSNLPSGINRNKQEETAFSDSLLQHYINIKRFIYLAPRL
jgi:hypothetical protein